MRRLIAVIVAGIFVGTGCAANSYRIPDAELVRLANIAPEQRSHRVLVSQEITQTDVASAEPVHHSTEVIWVPEIRIGHHHRPHHDHYNGGGSVGGSVSGGSRGGSSGGGKLGGLGKLGTGGSDGKAAAVAILVLAAVILVAAAGVEGSRFDGWVQLHPMHPVHLIGKDGTQTVMPLAWIDPQAAAWTEKAIVRPHEGPWRTLERHPLMRSGTYGMYGGSGSSKSVLGDVNFGPSFAIQGGYFPHQMVGVVASLNFAWRDNQFGGTLFDTRYMAELQAFPLVAGPLHAGGYVGAGLGYRWEDVPGATLGGNGNGNNGTTAFTGGAMLQLDVHSRIALTARMGAVRAHGDRMTDLLFGISVY